MGVGKSSVGWEIFTQLRNAGIKTGYADADQLGLCYPAPDDDPVNHGSNHLTLAPDPSVISSRFLQRGWNPSLVDEAIREATQLKHAEFADLRVDTDDHSVKEVAEMVRTQVGNWPGLT